MYYEGKIYRPWMEADSVLIQTTLGCTHNKCSFCDMFREKRFRIRNLDDIFKDIDEARTLFPQVKSIFLIDGNVLALKTDFLLKLLRKLTTTIPECSKIALYAGLNDMRRKSVEELKEIKQAGLTKIYSGLESGDQETLDNINKNLTVEQAEHAMNNAKAAGIEVLLSIIFGIGGRNRSKTHIVETTKLLNILKPEEIAPMALTIQPGTQLKQQVESKDFIQATPMQILEEEKYLLENITFPTFYWGDHGNNIVSLRGYLPENKQRFLDTVSMAMDQHPVTSLDVLHTSPW